MNSPAGARSRHPSASTPPISRFRRFRDLLRSPQLEFIMEAHSGLSAKLVEEVGFKGIWASGLTMSAAMGVRDRNEASWTQVLETLEFMADATSIPIMLDGDTGYGDFNNFRRLVTKLCQRDVAAVCIEDKMFPKTNSFIDGRQALANVDEFCGKIKAGKDSQLDDDFSIVARIEAFIAGWGLDEALRRAEAYHAAGADAILIHSREHTADEVLRFAAAWGNRGPVVLVPTKYYRTPTARFTEAAISLVIWANHSLRASVEAMRDTCARIHADQSLTGVEEQIAPVQELFRLSGEPEIAEATERYGPSAPDDNRAVILAASRGSALGPLTEETPKCMVDVRGAPLLDRLVRSFNRHGINQVTVVTGYKAEAVDVVGIDTVRNADHARTGEASSLACARDALDGPCMLVYGDTLFREYLIRMALDTESDITVLVDSLVNAKHRDANRGADLVRCSKPYSPDYLSAEGAVLTACDSALSRDEADGEWIGLAKLTARGAELVRTELDAMREEGILDQADLPDLFNRLIQRGEAPAVVYVNGDWLDVNNLYDLASARNFV